MAQWLSMRLVSAGSVVRSRVEAFVFCESAHKGGWEVGAEEEGEEALSEEEEVEEEEEALSGCARGL